MKYDLGPFKNISRTVTKQCNIIFVRANRTRAVFEKNVEWHFVPYLEDIFKATQSEFLSAKKFCTLSISVIIGQVGSEAMNCLP